VLASRLCKSAVCRMRKQVPKSFTGMSDGANGEVEEDT
jgi:hypothetical protein